jgi:hypothetical protein
MLSGPKMWFAALAALGGISFSGDAGAGEYTCHVPVAVLCQGCANHVVIALQPGGGCRVSFNPAPSSTSPVVAGAVDLQIQTGASAPARRKPGYHRGHIAVARQSPSHPCFVFNDQQYCE